MNFSPELLIYVLTAVTSAASAYGAIRSRLSMVERKLDAHIKETARLSALVRQLLAKRPPAR